MGGPRGARTRNLRITSTRQGCRRESIEIRTFCLARMTNARTEAANLHAKNIKRAGGRASRPECQVADYCLSESAAALAGDRSVGLASEHCLNDHAVLRHEAEGLTMTRDRG